MVKRSLYNVTYRVHGRATRPTAGSTFTDFSKP